MMHELNGVAVNRDVSAHLTDHLGPLGAILGVPLLLTTEQHAEYAQAYYPELRILLRDWEELNLQYLVEHFDIFFLSQFWSRDDFYSKCRPWEDHFKKTVRNVHCPHGFSDKVFWHEVSAWEDILLVYGENMMDLLRSAGVDSHLNLTVHSGNYRYHYYRKHQSFYDQLVEKLFWHRLDRTKPTIFYAPTYLEQEGSTSFFDAPLLLDRLPMDYNLVVKVHPNVEENDAVSLYRLMAKYDDRPNILFIKDFHVIYPLLARSDIYVGDMSSIGYDFLAFNRPMFFLNQLKRDPEKDRSVFLYRCGVEIKPEQYRDFYRIMEATLPSDNERYASIRQDVYRYTFGEEVSPESLKKAILHACALPKKTE